MWLCTVRYVVVGMIVDDTDVFLPQTFLPVPIVPTRLLQALSNSNNIPLPRQSSLVAVSSLSPSGSR